MSSSSTLRAIALDLDKERLALERQVGLLVEALGEFVTGSLLIDNAPRGDIDIASILELRGTLARCRNDLAAKMREVEAAMLAAMNATDD